MQIEQMNLRQRIEQARLSFDTQLAEVLVTRPDLSHAEIQRRFGISEKVIRRVKKQFNIVARRRGSRLKRQALNAVSPKTVYSPFEGASAEIFKCSRRLGMKEFLRIQPEQAVRTNQQTQEEL